MVPFELNEKQIDELLEVFDNTDRKMQRAIIAKLAVLASAFKEINAAIEEAPDPDQLEIAGTEAFGKHYASWYHSCVEKSIIGDDAVNKAKELTKKFASEAEKCKCCCLKVAIKNDQYGRCFNCLDQVPDRRGGWRQLGMYDG